MEIWKDINGLEGMYQVSDHGRVRSLDHTFKRRVNGRVHKPRTHTGGYLRVQIHRKDYYIHRLVADAFFDPDPLRLEVNHIDSNKKNNHVTNLERCTRGENISHGYRVGHRTNPGAGKTGKLNSQSKEILAIKDLAIIQCDCQKEMAKILGVCHQTVSEALLLGNKCMGYNLYRL